MANTMTLIQSVTVPSGGSASIDFTSIPSTYTDLCVLVSTRNTSGNYDSSYLRFNSSATGYSTKYLVGDGSAASSGNGGSTQILMAFITDGSTNTANTFGNASVYIPNYAGSNYKSVSIDGAAETNATGVGMGLTAGLWSNTSAITAVNIISASGTFAQYSTAYLYGIRNS